MPSGHPGSGWTYRLNNSSYCKSCNKRTEYKPKDTCSEKEHFIEHNRHLEEMLLISQEDRIKVLQGYGGKCACCGFDDITKKVRGATFLEIDHVNGRDKNDLHTGTTLYRWLIRNNFPKEFRILCGGCNDSMEHGEEICELHKWEAESFKALETAKGVKN